MKYRLSNIPEAQEARHRLEILIAQGKLVELKAIDPKRTLSQNSYLHLLLSAFGAHFGYTLEEAKLIYKQINRDMYYYEKKGREFILSSADLNKEEMAKSVDRFMQKSSDNGYDLPLGTNQEWILQIENEIEGQRKYL